jgi:transposase
MRRTSRPAKEPAEQVVKDIRRATRRHFSTEDGIRIVLDGLGGEDSIADALPARVDCPEPQLPVGEGVS